jgi:hypothetical protein
MRDYSSGQPRSASLLTIAVAGIALLAAACGGSSSTSAQSPATRQNIIAFTQCMRSHGEPNWPAPTGQRKIDVSHIDVASPRYARTSAACAILKPAGIKIQESAAQQRAASARQAKFTACLHSHGVTPGSYGPSPSSPRFRTVMKACGAVSLNGTWWVSG